MAPVLDIVIPTCKQPSDVESLVREISETSLLPCNVIVASSQGSASKNRNDGLDKTTTPYVCMLDDDICKLPKGWDKSLVDILKNYPTVSVVSARLTNQDGSPGIMGNEPYLAHLGIQPARFIPTACIVFKNTPLRFDETFIGSGFEDNDFLDQLGPQYVIANGVKVVHLNEAKNQKGYYWQTNQTYYATKKTRKHLRVALYKTLLGGEWLENSLASIYDYVDRIVVVDSDVMWGGDNPEREWGGLNNCTTPLLKFAQTRDPKHKIHTIGGRYFDQESQYDKGLEYIKETYPQSYILLVDSDEAWTAREMQKLWGQVLLFPEYASYHCATKAYVKSPFYRVEPDEPCKPTVVLNTAKVKSAENYSARFGNLQPALFLPNIYYHHFTAVRASLKDIENKLRYDEHGDSAKLHQDWLEKVWPRLPDAKDFHYEVGHESSWAGIKEVGLEDLPLVVRKNPLVLSYLKGNG